MNWIQVVYFKLKEIWPLFSTAKDKKRALFYFPSTKANENMKVWNQICQEVTKVNYFTEELIVNWILVVYFKLTETFPC